METRIGNQSGRSNSFLDIPQTPEFIVDFVCLSKQLVVEVDGKYHDLPEQQKADVLREQCLLDLGYRTIRFTNSEILVFPEQVIAKIKKELNS